MPGVELQAAAMATMFATTLRCATRARLADVLAIVLVAGLGAAAALVRAAATASSRIACRR